MLEKLQAKLSAKAVNIWRHIKLMLYSPKKLKFGMQMRGIIYTHYGNEFIDTFVAEADNNLPANHNAAELENFAENVAEGTSIREAYIARTDENVTFFLITQFHPGRIINLFHLPALFFGFIRILLCSHYSNEPLDLRSPKSNSSLGAMIFKGVVGFVFCFFEVPTLLISKTFGDLADLFLDLFGDCGTKTKQRIAPYSGGGRASMINSTACTNSLKMAEHPHTHAASAIIRVQPKSPLSGRELSHNTIAIGFSRAPMTPTKTAENSQFAPSNTASAASSVRLDPAQPSVIQQLPPLAITPAATNAGGTAGAPPTSRENAGVRSNTLIKALNNTYGNASRRPPSGTVRRTAEISNHMRRRLSLDATTPNKTKPTIAGTNHASAARVRLPPIVRTHASANLYGLPKHIKRRSSFGDAAAELPTLSTYETPTAGPK